ncbi:MAG: ribonuclease P protein component [Oscillatoriaceae bacterium SKW80]|nr:ribonuclease P protein component [Oscillatoriaceae bacterium SKYG93]MCX8120445.1 ribonuclease P protein component [Oscillatoriaceae bacterium SKW80]MDW8452980.1 ribonuclease P protein component [Oscillatoriaceae cyanobacterium SKYGB_i_bin93]HIK28577.1 ribonuclease P protein component [Oscillatoriaceae cyanobacterium M7585_C2015_266]
MLPNQNRLRHRQDFNAVYRNGIRRRGQNISLRGLRAKVVESEASNTGGESPPKAIALAPRFGLSVSQKVSKRAVVRNRVKRLIRAAIRKLLPRVSPGWDLIVIAQPGAQECNYSQILQELEQLLAQAEVLNGD